MDSDSDFDEEELEPFFMEKQNCKAVLDYLTQLNGQVDRDALQEMASVQGNQSLVNQLEVVDHHKLDKGSSTGEDYYFTFDAIRKQSGVLK